MEESREALQERFELSRERIREIEGEHFGEQAAQAAPFETYFARMAEFIRLTLEYEAFVPGRGDEASLEEWQEWNERLYGELLPGRYEKSFWDPAYAAARLGEKMGPLLSVLAREMRSLIPLAAGGDREGMLLRMELFVEVYGAFSCAWQEEGCLAEYEQVRQILYWYVSDYAEVSARQRAENLGGLRESLAARVLREADCKDVRYLYRYGCYVTEYEIRTARFLAELPQETVDLMASTFTEGYRMGFELGGKDLSREGLVELVYEPGFERMMQKAVENFGAMGLKPVVQHAAGGLLDQGRNVGVYINRQYSYDHKDDQALVLDKALMNRRLEVTGTAFEHCREALRLYAGPAVVETFGEAPFQPVNKKEALSLDERQQKLIPELYSGMMATQMRYIPEEERSFTIIAFPNARMGEHFEEIFQDIVRINTLDYQKYRRIQQRLIDALDGSDRVEIKGINGNRTDLRVKIRPLENPEKETAFENCVADVNIPVGEVFTSPVLEGTEGVLHVSRVFLNELEYRDLSLTFERGRIKEYDCGNFENPQENQKWIRENLLFHHDTLPMGEFAIGTNTTAYVVTRKWGMEAKMPILIAEKMGPHFAVGDTCYAHAEEIRTFNPDGKEIVARDNELSRMGKEKPMEAYFNCHTDITIPYDELGEITAVAPDGTRTPILLQGRFVLDGCQELNEPLEDEKLS